MAYTHPGRSTWFAGAAPPRLVPPLTREHPHQRCHARGHPRHGRVSLTCVATPRPRPGGFPRVGGVDRTAELNDGGGWADLGLLRNRRPDGSGLASRGAGIRHQCASHVPGPPQDMDCERPHLRGRGGCPPPRPLTLGYDAQGSEGERMWESHSPARGRSACWAMDNRGHRGKEPSTHDPATVGLESLTAHLTACMLAGTDRW